ncbi:MAG: hypothetical protein SNJ77_11105 [Cytophagales bacterium]
MNIKFTQGFLNKLEEIFSQSDYVLRYEKGHFKSGFCILNDQKIVVVNKFNPLEGKINALIEILKNLELDVSKMDDKSKSLYYDLVQNKQLNLLE